MPWVTDEPSGPGETFLFYDNESVFGDWDRVVVDVTPATAMRALGHLEASGATRPGDAPGVWGMAKAGIAPGAPEAMGIYGRMADASASQGYAYDADEVARAPDPNLPEGWHYETLPNGQRIAVGGSTPTPGAGEFETPEDEGTTLWGVVKGASRWLGMAIDVIGGEGWNALQRAAYYVTTGELSPREALAGMTQGVPLAGVSSLAALGMSEEELEKAGEMVGLPFFQYFRAAMRGERLNMGTGFFATGDVPEDVQSQLSLYDDETHGEIVDYTEEHGLFGLAGGDPVRSGGLNEADYQRRKEMMGGKLVVEGLGGLTYEAKNLDEWKFLRDNVGRAALLSSLSETSTEQAAIGTPYGSYQKPIFNNSSVLRRFQTGNYFATSYGRTLASVVTDPGTTAFNNVSGTLDFGNQIMDLGVIAQGTHVLRGGNRFTGLADEAGELAQGTSTLVRMVEGADEGARVRALEDATLGRLNVDRATDSLARYDDTPLASARNQLNALRAQAQADAVDPAVLGNTPYNIDALVSRAAKGNANARRILDQVMSRSGAEDAVSSVDNLLGVQAREGTDLTRGVWGAPVVDDAVRAARRTEAEHLSDLVANRRASVILDPTNGKQMLTFDADIGRAQQTLTRINDAGTTLLKDRKAAATNYGKAVRAYQDATPTRNWDEIGDDELVEVFHSTSRETAEQLASRGVRGSEKVPAPNTTALTGDGVYVGADPDRLRFTFGAGADNAPGTVLGITVRKGDLIDSPEALRLYPDAPRGQAALADPTIGARITGDIPSSRIRIVDPDEIARGVTSQYGEVINAAQNPLLKGVVDASGRVLNGTKLHAWESMDEAAEAEKLANQISQALFAENWAMGTRRAANLIGDTPENADEIENLMRVMKRTDGDGILAPGGARTAPRLKPEQVTQLLAGGGKARQLVENLAAARTHDEIQAILKPTKELMGELPPPFVNALAKAQSADEVVEAWTRYGAGQFMLPPRMSLLGNAAKFGTATTSLGLAAGGVGGAYEQFAAGGDPADIIGGAIGGALFGAVAGSAIAGGGGWLTGNASRTLDDVADAMDLILAGTRSTTADFLRSNGVNMGAAQAGLSVPSQLQYAYQHSPLGRRLGRGAATDLNLSDPTDFYYKLSDYARSLGLRLNDEVEIWTKGSGSALEKVKVVTSRALKEDEVAALAARRKELVEEGFSVSQTFKMDDVMTEASGLIANNIAASHRALIGFGKVADAVLASKGMDAANIDMLTSAFRQGAQEFLGATNAAAMPSGYAQNAAMSVDGDVFHLGDQALLDSELWGGHIELPSPERVFRAVNQLDTVGRTVQLFTGRGVASQIRKNMAAVGRGDGWTKITPELERNIANNIARTVTSGVWGTVVLLGRPLSFASKVLGEDQFRMTAASLNSMFSHPWNYVSAIAANFSWFKQAGIRPFGQSFGRYGIASRADLADIDWLDEAGNITPAGLDEMARQAKTGPDTRVPEPDQLDDIGHWGLAEKVRHALAIYAPEVRQARRRSVFGSRAWVAIDKNDVGYIDGLATEYRQLVHSPIIQHMARSKSSDPVEDTFNWLQNTVQGRAVAANWARQFQGDPRRAAMFMEPKNLKAFLADQHARMHLKTGGDWVFAISPGVVVDSVDGVPLPKSVLEAKGWLDLTPGYHVYRKGDEELLEILRRGEMKVTEDLLDEYGAKQYDISSGEVMTSERDLRISGDDMNEEKWNAIAGILRRKHKEFEGQVVKEGADPWLDHRFPKSVKGEKITNASTEMQGKGVVAAWDDGIDRMFQWWLGKPSRVLSRQPTMGGFFWERIGMLMPSMTDEMARNFRNLAKAEGTLKRVDRIAAEFRANGPAAKGTLDNVGDIDLNAKAYAIEQTRNILFDLHRQRNFVDGMRLIFPFAGPFVEALEAWGRVMRRDPLKLWRRGTQMVSHTWNTTGIGDQPDPFNTGWFTVDPETGDEMFQYPIGSTFFPDVLRDASGGDVSMNPIEARARQLNVVFGTDDLAEEGQAELAGIPLQAFQPGVGPILQVAAPLFWQNRTGTSREIFEFIFPYGTPENFAAAALPYNLRKAIEGVGGLLGQNSKDMTAATADQYARMMATGAVGPGREFDVSVPGGSDAAWEEAQNRATAATIAEAVARTLLPAMVTPEVAADIADNPQLDGLDLEKMTTIEAVGNWAYDLLQPETAAWFRTPDGYQVSTEGDWEVVTAYMNQVLGMDMYSAELLSIPLTDRAFPAAYTTEGLDWVRQNDGVMRQFKSTGSFLMPGYANAKAKEDEDQGYSFEAFDEAVRRGDASFYTFDQQKEQINSRLLKLAHREIEREADARYGFDDDLEGEAQEAKDFWMRDRKDAAAGQFRGGDLNEAQRQTVFDELTQWDRADWDWNSVDLDPQERATVDAMMWYLDVRRQAMEKAREYGIAKLDHKGDGDDQQAIMRGLREDVRIIVANQFTVAQNTRTDMGNFRYLWTEYLEPELIEKEDDYDALADLAARRAGEYGMEDLNRPGMFAGTRVPTGITGWTPGAGGPDEQVIVEESSAY